MTTKKNNVVNSSILMISASWLAKALGLISTIILARLLTPNDFGLVSIVMLVIYFFNIFSETGCKQYLLSLPEVTNQELNTAWTLNIISKTIISGVIMLFAPYSASFFSEPQLTMTLYVSALIPFINGLENPAIYLAKRNFNYQGIFKLNLISKIISFTITISLAYYLKSHWALIFGTLTHFSLMTIGSYFIMPFKPSFSLKQIKKQWDYSKWIFVRGLVGYTRAKIDTFILAKSFLTAELGLFNVAKEFAMLLQEQIAMPLQDIVMTSVQKVKGNEQNVASVIEKFSTLLVCLILPAVIGLAMLSDKVMLVVLGEQWLDAAPLLAVLAILGFSTSLVVVLSAALSALSKTKLIFQLDLITTSLILVILVLSRNLDITTFAMVRSLLGFVVLFGYLLALRFVIKLRLLKYLVNMIPALLASTAMYFTLKLSQPSYLEPTVLNLISLILIGALSYLMIFLPTMNRMQKYSISLQFVNQQIMLIFDKTRNLILRNKH
jgi:O-antigen/teichoic acid export membrane protein